MGCFCSYTERRRLYTLTFANDLGDEVAVIANNVDVEYNELTMSHDPYLYNTSILLEKNSELYPQLVEELKCKSSVYILCIEHRQKVDSVGKVHKTRYLISYEVVNKEPVSVTVLSSKKRNGYYEVELSKGVDGMTNNCYSFTYFSSGIHEVTWSIDACNSIIIEEI